jgi:hypothetical protein
MTDFWKWYLALIASISLMLAYVGAEVATPTQNGYPAPDNGYPVTTATERVPLWIDGCGAFHYTAVPDPFPTAIPADKIFDVCYGMPPTFEPPAP